MKIEEFHNVSVTTVQGYRIFYREQGRGKAVFFIHGLAGASGFWTNILSTLPRGFRGLAPDLLGFGDSEKPRIEYSIPAHAEMILELADLLELQEFDLIGHSMGGMIATIIALRSPERIGKLILVNVPINGVRALHGRGRLGVTSLGILLVRIGLHVPWILWVLRKVSRYYFVLDPKFTDDAKKAPFHSLRGHGRALCRTDLSQRLKDLSVPTMVIGTDRDGIVRPSEFSLAAQEIIGAKGVWIHDAGHCPTLEKPGESQKAIFEFLQNEST
jgi:pimeloyl-ACP methyl ester carboxylesterase